MLHQYPPNKAFTNGYPISGDITLRIKRQIKLKIHREWNIITSLNNFFWCLSKENPVSDKNIPAKSKNAFKDCKQTKGISNAIFKLKSSCKNHKLTPESWKWRNSDYSKHSSKKTCSKKRELFETPFNSLILFEPVA